MMVISRGKKVLGAIAICAAIVFVALKIQRIRLQRVTVLNPVANASGQCTPPKPDSIIRIRTQGKPFQALPSNDGCWMFVTQHAPSTVALYGNINGSLRLSRMLYMNADPMGMQQSHDGRTLIVVGGSDIVFVVVRKLVEGMPDPIEGTIHFSDHHRMEFYVAVTSDDRFAFVNNERTGGVTVVDIAKARATKFDTSAAIGLIPTGYAPVGMTFSPDQKLMYVVSQEASEDAQLPLRCRPEDAAGDNVAPDHVRGTIETVDVATARTNPSAAVLNTTVAGCNPVRIALSLAGDIAFVTARDDDALLVLDTKRMRIPNDSSIIARVPVGTAPVGVLVTNDGGRVLVANSNRFRKSAKDEQTVSVIDATGGASGHLQVVATIPAGAFPRELVVMPGSRTLVITNYNSRDIELVNLTSQGGMRERPPSHEKNQ
jgi:hypothetical protein